MSETSRGTPLRSGDRSPTLRRALLDSAGSLVPLGGLELLEGLQALSLLPHMFSLP